MAKDEKKETNTNSFETFQNECIYRTYQDSKCVHESSKQRLKVGSCVEALCPIFKKTT